MTSVTTDQRLGVNADQAVKVPCAAASTSNLTLSGEQTVDGVALVTGDRMLATGQTDTTENGIWVVDTGAWTRPPDWDGANDVVYGTIIFVNAGTNNLGYWQVTTSGTITPDTTSVALSQTVPGAYSSTLLIIARTAEEIAAGVTPVNYYYPMGHVARYGAIGDGVTDDTTAINNALSIGVDVYFDRLDYLISATLNSKASGTYPAGYGQTLHMDGTTITADSGFTGTEMLLMQGAEGKINGWVDFQAASNVQYCVQANAANITINRIRCYNFTDYGIYQAGRFGLVVNTMYGAAGSGNYLIYITGSTGPILTNIQSYRAEGYVIGIVTTIGFQINGGTPDKCDLGHYISQSSGTISAVNYEGTKYPALIDRSYVDISGCRFISNGGNALSPENSTDAISLDIGSAATRKANTYLLSLTSGRVRTQCNQISGYAEVEYHYKSTDASGTYSNYLYENANQVAMHDLTTTFTLTTQVHSGIETTRLDEHSTDYTTTTSAARIELDTQVVDSGFNIPFAAQYYTVPISGLYLFEYECTFDSTSTAATVTFSLVFNPGTVIKRTNKVTITADEPYTFRHYILLNATNQLRFQGVPNTGNCVMANPQLRITRVNDYKT